VYTRAAVPVRLQHLHILIYRMSHHSIGHSKHKVYMYMRSVPNGFRGRAIALYGSKIVHKKEIQYYVLFLIAVFIVQVTKLVQVFDTFSKLCNSCEDMACCSSVQ
jgi:hypothetical protein